MVNYTINKPQDLADILTDVRRDLNAAEIRMSDADRKLASRAGDLLWDAHRVILGRQPIQRSGYWFRLWTAICGL